MFSTIDIVIFITYALVAFGLAFWSRRQSNESHENSSTTQESEGVVQTRELFLGGRNLGWFAAGTSMVATTFAADTPIWVAGVVAAKGIAANWVWWNVAIAHVIAAVWFSRRWQRSGVVTDAELTELRYSGPWALRLRVFKALFFGVILNVMTMAWVIKAMVKISEGLFPSINSLGVVTLCVLFSATYTSVGGFRSVVRTDGIQFALGMSGSLALAFFCVRHLSTTEQSFLIKVESALRESGHPSELWFEFFPTHEQSGLTWIYFCVLMSVGWWRYAEGNGYMVQRLSACRSPEDADKASLWFAIAHNALRPWPWIVVGLGLIVLYPNLEDKELGYSLAMAELLPAGWLGVASVSLVAAFMSTMDTHTNWGASYLINDIVLRVLKPDASNRQIKFLSRVFIFALATGAGLASTQIDSIAEVWKIFLAIGAGLGSVSAIRWFWRRVNVFAELGAMVVTLVLTLALQILQGYAIVKFEAWQTMLLIALGSLVTWVSLSLTLPGESEEHWERFQQRTRDERTISTRFAKTLFGIIVVYVSIFAIGSLTLKLLS